RAHPMRPAIQHKRHHHRRLIRRAPETILAVAAIKPRQVDHANDIDDEPRQMILRKPITQIWRKQKRLFTITRQEVLSHTRILRRHPDRTPGSTALLCDSLA